MVSKHELIAFALQISYDEENNPGDGVKR